MADKLVKVDKNGTKYYADYTCQRCGGAGYAEKWRYTGLKCYECGGSGQSKAHIYKVYTPEYRAKLDERSAKMRAKREAKEAEELAKRVATFKDNLMELIQPYGFNAQGKTYWVMGKTYEIREELKEAGATYHTGSWVFIEPQEKYPTIELDYTECLIIHPEYATIDWQAKSWIDGVVKAKLPKEPESQYIGEIGERLDIEVTLNHIFSYERKAMSWGYETVFIYKFKDSEGNILVWNTTAYRELNEGAKLQLRGTVKEHSEYKGEKQTVLLRCKLELK